MNSLLLWIGGLLVAVLGLLFAVPYAIDWNTYRGVFEEEATRILGRDVRVGGKVNLRLLPSPYVRFEKVRISDAGAALGEPFFRAEAFTLWLSPGPLLRGAIEAKEIELDRPVLRLAVDAGGNGNWQRLRISPGSLPFVPSEVVLQEVRIRDGVVSLKTPSTPEPLTLSAIDGELAASALDGPYRFRGTVKWGDAQRELRVVTAQGEAEGPLRYKASVRALDSGNVYSVDGSLSELTGRGRHTGVLTARLPLASLVTAAGEPAPAVRAGDIVDLKGNIEGDIDGMRLSDLQLGIEQAGKPQLVSGDVVASWRNGLRTETQLKSRWLDIDQLAGGGIGGGPGVLAMRTQPIDVLRRAVMQLGAMLPSAGTSLLTIDVDQLNLAGEALGGVRLALVRTSGLTSIGELRASLPGNARGEVRGRFIEQAAEAGRPATGAGPTVFDGEVVVHGASYRRFLAWAGLALPAEPTESVATAVDSSFAVASHVVIEPERLRLGRAAVEAGGRNLEGTLDWRWGRERELAVALEGRTIDLSGIAPGLLTGLSGRGGSAGETGSALLTAIAAQAGAVERAIGRFRLQLRTPVLTDGTTELADVEADLTWRADRLDIARLRLAGATGARIDVQGGLAAAGSKPQGTLRGWLSADTREGMATLIGHLPNGLQRASAGWVHRLAKADVGFMLTMGGNEQSPTTLSLNGTIDAMQVGLDLRLEGGASRWSEAPIDMALSLQGPGATALLRGMAIGPALQQASVPAASRDGGVVRIRAAGSSASALVGLVSVENGEGGKGLKAQLDGRFAIDAATGAVVVAGALGLNGSAGDLLALAAGPLRVDGLQAPVRGTVGVERNGGRLRLSGRDLMIAGRGVGGELVVTKGASRTRIDADIATADLALLGLAGLLFDGARDARPGAGAPAAGVEADESVSPWPDAPLSLTLLEGVEGRVLVRATRAVLAEGLEIGDAVLDIGLAPGRLTLTGLTGTALGGRVTMRGAAVQGGAGLDLTLDTRITGAGLARLAGHAGGAGRNLGEGNLAVSLAGRATSLRAATSQLTGRGEIELRNARVEGIGGDVIEKAAAGIIGAAGAQGTTDLPSQLERARAGSAVVIGNRKLSIEVADGVAKVAALEVSTPEATLRNATTVDLGMLRAESEWRITPRRPLPGTAPGADGRTARDPLPPVGIIWTGPIAGLAATVPRLSSEALEREITIRRMEWETERLEEIRRRDEQRALEVERERRSQEGHSAPAPSAAAAVPQVAPPGVPHGAPQVVPQAAQPAAPVIEAPLPINQGASAAQADPAPVSATRPPPPRPRPPRRDGGRTLMDAVMGNQ